MPTAVFRARRGMNGISSYCFIIRPVQCFTQCRTCKKTPALWMCAGVIVKWKWHHMGSRCPCRLLAQAQHRLLMLQYLQVWLPPPETLCLKTSQIDSVIYTFPRDWESLQSEAFSGGISKLFGNLGKVCESSVCNKYEDDLLVLSRYWNF